MTQSWLLPVSFIFKGLNFIYHTCFKYFYYFYNLLTTGFLNCQLYWIWEVKMLRPTLDTCQVVLTLDEWDTYFILQHLMVASSKHYVSHKVDDSRVVSRYRSTNKNNGTEESIISYCRWWLWRKTVLWKKRHQLMT